MFAKHVPCPNALIAPMEDRDLAERDTSCSEVLPLQALTPIAKQDL